MMHEILIVTAAFIVFGGLVILAGVIDDRLKEIEKQLKRLRR